MRVSLGRLRTQHASRIHPRRAPGRQDARCDGAQAQHDDDGGDREGVEQGHAEELFLDDAAERLSGGHAEDGADGGEGARGRRSCVRRPRRARRAPFGC